MRVRTKLLTAVFSMGLAALVAFTPGLEIFAQDTIGLGTSKDDMSFQGTGTQVINVVWQNCGNSGCSMSGSAIRMREFQVVGAYKFLSPGPRPFKLIATPGLGLFDIEQSSPISFEYTSPHGSLQGMVHFASVVQNTGSIAASLTGTLQVTGGTFAPAFASGPGIMSLTVAVGKKNLSTLVASNYDISGAIDATSMLTPPALCRTGSAILANVNGAPLPGGTIWFNANFRATGAHDGTYLQFQGGFVQFASRGNDQILHVPNAVVTFSASVTCPSTTYDASTDTWQTTVPLKGTEEIFLSGFALPVPASGFPGGLPQVSWSESFASNTPGISMQWRWSAEVFSSFSTDYNSLGIKPAQPEACARNQGDPAGRPENFTRFTVGESSRPEAVNSWSEAASAHANCP